MSGTVARRPRVYIPGRKLLTGLPIVALLVVGGADLASVALVKVSVPDNANEAARAGVMAVDGRDMATPRTAETAYNAANAVADLHRMTIDPQTFTVYADGSVELTAHRSAPTMLFKHIPGLKTLTDATVSVRVSRPDW
ncbi:hypothetical protein [Sporichthya polymorpha]|uniref:hypothetical protein n=1 Tax=Sporichthya polymorpha TaxID=35751 RepID=UPI00038248C1|nr:hypothetical protein [Sporichthya polymorpha]